MNEYSFIFLDPEPRPWDDVLNRQRGGYMRCLANSNAHFKRALGKLPLGVSSNFRYWGDKKTIYIKRGKGGRVWDIDGNEYIDYRLAYGPVILGYGDPRVDEAAIRGMEVGGVFALSTELEYEVACRVSRMVPSAELVRFSNSGTEAVMAALRVARAYTGKDAHVVVEGGYHGVFSEVMWYSDIEDWDPKDGAPPIMPFGDGIPAVLKRLYHTLPLNDANAVEDLLKRHHEEIGAFMIEPIMGNCCAIAATREYMQAVRELCDRYNVVLIIDEVKTGFRVAKGGVQELLGVNADICTFAKALGNGYPIAIVAGREDIMRHFGEGVVHGGTFTGHSVSLAAANRTLQILDETSALADIADYGRQLQQGMSRILGARKIEHSFTGHPALMGLFFARTPPSDYRSWLRSDYDFYDALAPNLHDEGVLVEPDSREPWFLCEAHTVDCLDSTLARFERAVDLTLEMTNKKAATA